MYIYIHIHTGWNIRLGMSSSQLMNSIIFQKGFKPPVIFPIYLDHLPAYIPCGLQFFKHAEWALPFKHTYRAGISYYLRAWLPRPGHHIFKCDYRMFTRGYPWCAFNRRWSRPLRSVSQQAQGVPRCDVELQAIAWRKAEKDG